jgi:hypothetical protein
MNSDEERALFEEYGWTYDYVARQWLAPDGATVTNDELVLYASVYGPRVESELLRVVRRHGRKAAG